MSEPTTAPANDRPAPRPLRQLAALLLALRRRQAGDAATPPPQRPAPEQGVNGWENGHAADQE
jgi:hypothetical protein